MILSRCCNSSMTSHKDEVLKTTGELKRTMRCTCCGKFYSAYSANGGETWKWEKRPAHRPRKVDSMVFA